MATQLLDLNRELPGALKRFQLDLPERVVTVLLAAKQQQKGHVSRNAFTTAN